MPSIVGDHLHCNAGGKLKGNCGTCGPMGQRGGFSVSNSDFCKSPCHLCGECTDMAGVRDVSDVSDVNSIRIGFDAHVALAMQ